MTISDDVEAHSRAVASLQALLSKHRPGSSPYRIAERALDLAFNRPPTSSGASELDLLAEAESLIERQVRSKLIPAPSPQLSPVCRPSERAAIGTRFVAWRGSLRPREAERFIQAELWLTPEGHSGDGYAAIR